MNELFKNEYNQANEKLYKAGYILCNMVYDNNYYELWRISDNEVVIDNLSFAQVVQLSNIL